ncbi:hypothetical protein CK203_116350 [Vitis vinifera]|uniref:Uncharacterized protein n=1 Tax=Vitis vinifera TaxID=29760 RepID=A0A438D7B3_VITVI|nr:hypothetical protein CK203_116350 [Vitis vinifera]
MLVIAFKGLGNSLRGKTLWQVACLTLVWIVWQEQNNRIFEDKGRSEETLWDLILLYSSLWASCSAAFRGVPLNVLQLNWSEEGPLILLVGERGWELYMLLAKVLANNGAGCGLLSLPHSYRSSTNSLRATFSLVGPQSYPIPIASQAKNCTFQRAANPQII